jgi:periplasmic protein TonB
MYSEENRAFSFAVLASIVLHAILLFGVSQRSRPLPAPEPQMTILARIAGPPAPAPAPVVIPPEVKPPPVEPPKPRPRAKAQAPKPIAKPVPEPAPAAPEPPAPPQVAEAPPAPAALPPVIGRTETAPASPVPPQIGTTLDPRTIAEYRMQILGAAPRYKRYPRLARENNWEGLVALRMQFGSNGRLEALSVTKTSGYDVLDKQAAEMFRNAAEAVPVPPLLRGKEFSVDVAAVYGLRD